MKIFLRAVWVASALIATGGAQTPPDAPAVSPDLRVTVRLKNGSTIHGVALDGRLVEKQVRGRFVPAEDREERTSGVRVWYYRDLDGFLFLPYSRVEKVEVRGEMTGADLTALREAMRLGAEERARDVPAVDPSDAGEPKEGPVLTEAERRLLSEYPPDQGWSAAKYGELQRRRILLGQELNAKESKFVESFEAWRAAQQKVARPGPKEPGVPSGEPPSEPTERRTQGFGGVRAGG